MDFSFRVDTFRTLFAQAVEEHIEPILKADDDELQQLVSGMQQAIDVMQRADVDAASQQAAGSDRPVLEQKDVSQIGDYTMTLLEGLVSRVESASGHQNRDLLRLTVPVALWVARRGGKIANLELVVNSLASYANELTDIGQLADLARVIREVIEACDDDTRRDLEQTNAMRPWRILNLNYGIVATRSHDPVLIDEAYAMLVKSLPQDARQFFREGMQQMDIIGYPEHVREVVARYDSMWGSDSTLH
jgi:hypothetical protein